MFANKKYYICIIVFAIIITKVCLKKTQHVFEQNIPTNGYCLYELLKPLLND